MRRRSFRCLEAAVVLAAAIAPSRAWAQACCAGSGALTPGRLMLHDEALAGAQVRGGIVHGSFDPNGHYAGNPAGTSEHDLEQDVFGAVRVLTRGQVALLVPFIETRRATPTTGSEFGGGLGDVNASVRYDFTVAGQSSVVPGIALLGGLTLPTGTPPDQAHNRLATDATGIGAYQGTLGLALEQTWGAGLGSATLMVSARTARSVQKAGQTIDETLGLQWQGLAGVAYAFGEEEAIALLVSYTTEGDATINGARVPDTARTITLVSVAGVMPLGERLRLQGGVFVHPPIAGLGQNLPAAVGVNLALLWTWS